MASSEKTYPKYPEWFRAEVEEWRARLLPGWRLELTTDADDEDSAAWIQWQDHRDVARAWFGPEATHGGKRQRDQLIIHEMLHPLFRDLRGAFMPDDENDFDHKLWVHLEELLVDRIARGVTGDVGGTV